jgi:hypothetical protein
VVWDSSSTQTENMHQGRSSVQELDAYGPPPSILAVAAVQFLGSLPFLYLCGISLWGAVWVTHEIANSPMLIVVLGLSFLFSLMAVVTSIGLLRLREWARRATLSLATLPVFGCALFLILYHPRDVYGAPFAVRDISHLVGKVLLAILIPVSIWWWVLFTRNKVRSQFRRDRRESTSF